MVGYAKKHAFRKQVITCFFTNSGEKNAIDTQYMPVKILSAGLFQVLGRTHARVLFKSQKKGDARIKPNR